MNRPFMRLAAVFACLSMGCTGIEQEEPKSSIISTGQLESPLGRFKGLDNTCDGRDDDRDEKIDEDYVGRTRGVGACACQDECREARVHACQPSAPEVERDATCNRIDDNCNGEIDEDVDIQNDVNNCGGCNQPCAFVNGTPLCREGVCRLGGCLNGFFNLDGNDANGCEYECRPESAGDEVCDGQDNDCDGVVDEGFSLTTDVNNCGSCGTVCGYPNAQVGCNRGRCTITACHPGFENLNGIFLDGCECQESNGGVEVCDNTDNDCDGNQDEGFDLQTDVNNCGDCNRRCSVANGLVSCEDGTCRFGGCRPGFYDLDGDIRNGCEYACNPASPGDELCDGDDNDCDGVIDEGVTRPCGSNVGACRSGVETCAAGGWGGCEGAVGPVAEICDTVDNDCNGVVDEGFRIGEACQAGLGECAVPGQFACGADGDAVCAGDIPAPLGPDDDCDGLDEDCDGKNDEAYQEVIACSVSQGVCRADGVLICVNASTMCKAIPLQPTGRDDDCDGENEDCDDATDEDYSSDRTCGLGVCQRLHVCTDGVAGCVQGPQTGLDDDCNAVNEDCDGRTDEHWVGRFVGEGLCRRREVCEGGIVSVPAIDPPIGDESICNGRHDDCDANIDEDYVGRDTACGVGACAAGGVTSCVGGDEQES